MVLQSMLFPSNTVFILILCFLLALKFFDFSNKALLSFFAAARSFHGFVAHVVDEVNNQMKGSDGSINSYKVYEVWLKRG